MRPVGEGTTGFTALELRGDDMGPERAGGTPLPELPIGRRSVLKGMGVGAVAAGASGVLAACGSGIKGAGGSGSTKNITIGWIHPLTGPLAGFGGQLGDLQDQADQSVQERFQDRRQDVLRHDQVL
jgi:hypothetical protein